MDKKFNNINQIQINESYSKKWEDLIELLLQNDYHKRPNIEEVYNYINKIKNEIILTVEFKKKNEDVTFHNKYSNAFKEMNEFNTLLYVNNKKIKFENYFKAEKKGIYIIKIIFNFIIKDCSYMFNSTFNCRSKFIDYDFSGFDTSRVTNMANMFDKCCGLKRFKPSLDTRSVTSMERMFIDCHDLEYIDLSSFDTRNVISMADMFYDCTKLKDIKLSSPSNNLINISGMFCKCVNLTNVDLSLFDTKNLEHMGVLFEGCEKLANIDLSSFDTRNVQSMYYLFKNCKNLTNINLFPLIQEMFKILILCLMDVKM